MNIRDDKNQNKKQYGDFNYIIKKKVNASTNAAFYIKTKSREHFSNKSFKPLHSKNLILNKTSHNHYPLQQHEPDVFLPSDFLTPSDLQVNSETAFLNSENFSQLIE